MTPVGKIFFVFLSDSCFHLSVGWKWIQGQFNHDYTTTLPYLNSVCRVCCGAYCGMVYEVDGFKDNRAYTEK